MFLVWIVYAVLVDEISSRFVADCVACISCVDILVLLVILEICYAVLASLAIEE